MTSYDWGRLAGWILFPLIVAAIVYGVGRLVALRLDPMRQVRARRNVAIGAIMAGLVVAAINFSPLIKLGGEDVSRMEGRFLTGFQKGCQDRCVERGGVETKCVAYCGCAAREISRRATREELREGKIGDSLRAKMVDAALFCAKESPPK